MSLYSKARKHIDMNRVKELREEEIKEQKIAEVKEQQEEILAELKRIEIKEDPKYYNWRRELEELNDDVNSRNSFSADSGSYILVVVLSSINGNFNGTLSGLCIHFQFHLMSLEMLLLTAQILVF